jgi:hypothetical protein
VSSILKALKKLETEPTSKVVRRSMSLTLDTAGAARDNRPHRWARILLSLLATALVAGGGVYLFFFFQADYKTVGKRETSTAHVTVGTEDQVTVGSAATGTQTAATTDDAAHGNVRSREAGGRETALPPAERRRRVISATDQEHPVRKERAAVRRQGSSAPLADSAGKTLSDTGDKPGPADKIPGNADSSTAELTAKVQPLGAVAKEDQPNVGDHVLPRLETTDMHLQAITWGVRPRDRFALVNNTIIRSGESISGFVVDRIYEDYIVVSKGDERWRLEFRLR